MTPNIINKLVGILSFGYYHFTENVPMTNHVKRCKSNCWCGQYENRIAERNYQYILDNWRKEVKNTDMRKPKRPLFILCMGNSVRYLDDKRELQRRVDHLKEHPKEPHWHIPAEIREEDFLEFAKYIPETLHKKLRYLYEAERL